VLYENAVLATYETATTEVTCGPLPVLDSPDPTYAPWYWRPKAFSPVVTGINGSVKATAVMRDAPQDPIPWESAHDGSDLKNIHYRLKFKTWLVVRDVTAVPFPQEFKAVLGQFDTVIDLTFNVDVSKAVGKRCNFATTTETKTRSELVSPPTPIHECVWTQRIANSGIAVVHKDRVVTASGYTPVGPVNTGVSVGALAKNTPMIMMMAPAPNPKGSPKASEKGKSGGLFSRLFGRKRAVPPVEGDE
jgi:hypothetical protein